MCRASRRGRSDGSERIGYSGLNIHPAPSVWTLHCLYGPSAPWAAMIRSISRSSSLSSGAGASSRAFA